MTTKNKLKFSDIGKMHNKAIMVYNMAIEMGKTELAKAIHDKYLSLFALPTILNGIDPYQTCSLAGPVPISGGISKLHNTPKDVHFIEQVNNFSKYFCFSKEVGKRPDIAKLAVQGLSYTGKHFHEHWNIVIDKRRRDVLSNSRYVEKAHEYVEKNFREELPPHIKLALVECYQKGFEDATNYIIEL